jgi:hypothetical protein
MVGGAALIAAGLLYLLSRELLGLPLGDGMRITGDILHAGALLLLAIGLSKDASVVARRPLGVTALMLLAVWPLLAPGIQALIGPPADNLEVSTALSYVGILVPLAAAIIAVVQIGRAGTVPRGWRWVPLWVLVAQVALGVLGQLVMMAVDPAQLQTIAGVAALLGLLSFVAGTLGLGIALLLLAMAERPAAVPVYRSTN